VTGAAATRREHRGIEPVRRRERPIGNSTTENREPMMSLPWRAFWILMTAFFVTKVIVGAHKAMAYFGVSPIWG
jgi:hypothetical protein